MASSAEATRTVTGLWSTAEFRRSLVPMVLADDDRCYVAVNAAASLLLRMPEREILKLRIDDLTPPEHRAMVEPLWDEFLRTGTQKGTFELLMPDGALTRIEYSATANIDLGRHLSIWMLPSVHDEADWEEGETRRALLTPRERQVLGMIAMGMDSGWIAAVLGVSHSTVETHVRHCLEKLGARNRAHAIVLGLRAGEISLDFSSDSGSGSVISP